MTSELETPRATSSGTWLEVHTERLAANLRAFRRHVGADVALGAVVKSNGYGHGLEIAAGAFVQGGADWLCVHSFREAQRVDSLALGVPIYVMGPLGADELEPAVRRGLEVVAYDARRLQELDEAATAAGRPARVHLKIETGTHRQGLPITELPAVLQLLGTLANVELVGVSSHFANVEDTTRHTYAQGQSDAFEQALAMVRDAGFPHVQRHMASSAATILFERTRYDAVRLGISAYGYWPSRETLASARERGLDTLRLEPALTWKTRIAQVKQVAAGSYVGYGCSHKLETDGRVAVLPVGYADGYLRSFGGRGWVLADGRRCPVLGRVCMNLTMIDVTHLPQVDVGHEVVLLGESGSESLAAETLADWGGTIHYEVLAGLSAELPRVAV